MEFEKLDEAIDYIYKKATDLTIESMNNGFGGPFGAGILKKENDKYKLITIKSNEVLKTNDPSMHAEVNAIRDACHKLNTYDLSDCILVSTSKSCPMCLSLSVWANIKEIYYSSNYDLASKSGFRDDKILEYLKGNNEIINEVNVKSSNCDILFDIWNNLNDKKMY